MTATATSTLTIPQRTVLNVAGRAAEPGDPATDGVLGSVLYGYPDVDMDIVYGLIDAGFLTGPHRWALEYGLARNEPDPETYASHAMCCILEYRRLHTDFFRYYLTERGRRFVADDPLNVVLRGVWFAPNRTLRLDRALALADGDKGLIRLPWDKGWFRMNNAVDGRETCFDGSSVAYEWRHPEDFVVKATHKIRSVLG